MVLLSWIPVLIGCYAIFELLFYMFHQEPLPAKAIAKLATKRRSKYLFRYYCFSQSKVVTVNKQLKSSMRPNGSFYQVSEMLLDTPLVIGALLKGKKHEWVVFAFENNKTIKLLWANKGPDNTTVSSMLQLEDILRICEQDKYSTVLRFHNHPNPNPSRFDCSDHSAQDIISANYYGDYLTFNGINFLDFVCERGNYNLFFYKYSGEFEPVEKFMSQIQNINGVSTWQNYKLHRELSPFLL